MTEHTAPVLVFTWGNPSRGDDALGPALYECLLEAQAAGRLPGVELLTDFQLQIEHALDLRGRERVIFVDASLDAAAPFDFRVLQAERDASFTTHAMSPGAVLSVFEQVERQAPPPAFLLSVCGCDFGLGNPLSPAARRHLAAARDFLMQQLGEVADAGRPAHAGEAEAD